MKIRNAIVGMLLMTSASGCLYAIRDEIHETETHFRNHMMAHWAYKDYRAAQHHQRLACPHTFKEGFEAGYIDILNGKTGCPPVMIPPKCHSHSWLDHCSPEEMNCAWYAGYSAGVAMAHGDDMVGANTLPIRAPQAMPAGMPAQAGYPAGPVETTPIPELAPAAFLPPPVPGAEVPRLEFQ